MLRHPRGIPIRCLLCRDLVTIRWMSRHPSGLDVCLLLRGDPVVGDSGMGVSSTSRAFVTSSSFLSFEFHVTLEGRLTSVAVGLAPVEGLDSLVSDDVASAGLSGSAALSSSSPELRLWVG